LVQWPVSSLRRGSIQSPLSSHGQRDVGVAALVGIVEAAAAEEAEGQQQRGEQQPAARRTQARFGVPAAMRSHSAPVPVAAIDLARAEDSLAAGRLHAGRSSVSAAGAAGQNR
jgi:hypothetical protein